MGVEDADVVVNETAHVRILAEILDGYRKIIVFIKSIGMILILAVTHHVVFENAVDDGCEETADERRTRMQSTMAAEGGAHFTRRRLAFQQRRQGQQ